MDEAERQVAPNSAEPSGSGIPFDSRASPRGPGGPPFGPGRVPTESEAVEQRPGAGSGLEARPDRLAGTGDSSAAGEGPRTGGGAGFEERAGAGAEAPLALPPGGEGMLSELFRECQGRVGAALQSQQALDDQLGRLAAGTPGCGGGELTAALVLQLHLLLFSYASSAGP